MKVVVAHNRYASSAPSGENTIVDVEIAQLTEAGVRVLPFLRSSDEIAGFGAARKALLPLSPMYNGPAQRQLSELIERERPDLLHLHNPYPLLSPWVVRTAHRHGVPVVQTVHNYRQVCAPGIYHRDGHICHDCRGRAFALPAIRHRCYRDSAAQSAIMATTLALHRSTWRSVDRYIALTDAIATHLRGYGIAAERIAVKPNSIPDPGPPPRQPGEGFVYAARLTPEKGIDLLLAAWRRHPDGAYGPLRIIGDGPLRSTAEAAAAERADISYLGPMSSAEVATHMRGAACVIAASTWEDVLPTVAIEAFANGRPVLGTALGGIPYLVGDAGWVVEPEPDAFAAGLAQAAAGAAELAPAARRRYEQTFAPGPVTRQLLNIYAEVKAR